MSLAGDILKAAFEKQQQLVADHAHAIHERAATLSEVIKKPWKNRVEAIGQAVAVVREIVKPTEDKSE